MGGGTSAEPARLPGTPPPLFNYTTMAEKKTSLKRLMIEMQQGARMRVAVGAYGYTTIRTYASMIGFDLERTYTVHLDRENRTYEITRTK